MSATTRPFSLNFFPPISTTLYGHVAETGLRFIILRRSFPIKKRVLTQVATFHMNGFFHFYDGILNLLFQHLDSIFNRILVCLAVTDNIFVLTCLLGSVQRYFFTESPFLDLLFLHVVYPVSTNQIKLG